MTDKKPERPARRKDGGDQPPRRRIPAKKPASAEPDAVASAFEGERIAKVMARAGACSRRDAEIWVTEGRVSVNGRVLDSPAFNVQEGDRIEVDGQPLAEREPTRLFLFHKPAGLVTSAKDPEGRETVFGFLEERFPDLPRLVSVGRLDINTEGLLLLTNDGGLARTLELPATGWTRRYRVRAHGEIDQARLDELKKGVTVDDVDYAPIDAKLDRVQGANVWISMALREGKNREIKRVLEHLGLDVNRLIRISFGPFQLGELEEGVVEEVRLKTLREQLGKGLAELAGVDFSSSRRDSDEPPHIAAEEARQRAKTRTRKHVTTLRAEREEARGKGPRARIERAATSDRKGRAVPVEKIVPVRRAEEPATTRNARRFRAERAEGEERPARVAGERKERFERGERAPRREGEGRPPRREGGAARPRAGERTERFDRGERRGSSFGAGDGPRRERAPRREGEGRPPRREGMPARAASGERTERFDRGERRGSSFGAGDGPRRERAPRREGEGRPPRREGMPARAASGERTERFDRGERRGSSFGAGDGPRRERAPRREGEGRPPRRDGAEQRPRAERTERFDRGERRGSSFGASDGPRRERAPRREGEERPPRREGAAARAPSGERFERGERKSSGERKSFAGKGSGKRFDSGDAPRGERAPRKAGEGRSPRRDGDARPPSGERRGPPRSGAGKGPGRGGPAGKGPGKGPRKPGGAPRKPR
ncbi:pseudouridine synthase [Methylosinus sporium]|nr:pseudouridine synthase [Methylosinus sporium]